MAARKVLGYTRVSTQEQVTGFGLEVQRKAIKDYCGANGLRLVRTLTDEGQSGTNGLDARVGLAEALAIVERGEVAGMIVARMDRLARDLLLQETLMARMRQAGAEVISVSEPDMDSDDPTRVLVRQVLGSISQFERALIRGRMMAGKAAKVAGGGYGGGRPPFGWRAEGKDLVRDEREQGVVALVRQLSDEGLSTRQIAARLEESGHRPKVGEHFSSVQVLRIIQRLRSEDGPG
jgi:DNA invertase Pin-like site-specific DNA recombinase